MKQTAFTLVELTVVLLVLAITAGAVALRVAGPMARAKVENIVGRIAQFDRTTRRHCISNDRKVRMVIDLGEGRLQLTDAGGRDLQGQTLVLPKPLKIAQVVLAEDETSSGIVTLSCSTRGLMQSYAMLVEGAGEREQWLMFCGLTGRVVEMDGYDQVVETFRALKVRDHAG